MTNIIRPKACNFWPNEELAEENKCSKKAFSPQLVENYLVGPQGFENPYLLWCPEKSQGVPEFLNLLDSRII